MRVKLFGWVASCVLFAAAPVHAACDTPEGVKQIENAALAAGGRDIALAAVRMCLGDPKGDPAPIVKQFDQLTPNVPTWPERRTHVHAALDALERFAEAKSQAAPNREQWLIVEGQLESELAVVDDLATVDSGGGVFLDNRFWLQDNRPGTPVANSTIELLAPLNCAAPPAECAAYEPRKELIRVFNLVRRLGDYADATKVNAHLKDAKELDTKWRAYFNDTQPQYWWEIILNGHAMKKEHCQAAADTGIQSGFCTVPDSQWILLHPAAAVQWVNGAENTGDLEPAFIVEVFGRNSWRWKNAAVSRQWGWSVLAAYSNRGAGQEKWSYGFLFSKGKDMKLGITTTKDDEFGILLTTSVAGKFFEQKQQYLDYLKSKDKTDWLSLLD